MINLQIEGLTKSFGDRVLFSDIAFGLSEGERVGLIAKTVPARRPCSISLPAMKVTMPVALLSATTFGWAICDNYLFFSLK